jgi:hypothetical protein
MKTTFLVSLIAVLTVLTFVQASGVLASGNLAITPNEVVLNGVTGANTLNVAITAGDVVPLKFVFTAGEEASNVKVKAELSTYRDDISATSDRFRMLNGNTYPIFLSLKVPTDFDPSEGLVLTITVEGIVNDQTETWTETFGHGASYEGVG